VREALKELRLTPGARIAKTPAPDDGCTGDRGSRAGPGCAQSKTARGTIAFPAVRQEG
jgi:hypothetical protein